MSSTYQVQFANQGILTLEDQSVVGIGRITPRLSFCFKASTAIQPGLTGRMLALELQVTFNAELVGTGTLPPQFHSISLQGASLPAIDVALSPAALEFLRDGVRSNDLVLGLKFSGLFQADSSGCPGWIQQQSPALLLPISSDVGTLQVAHSDWVRKILNPLSAGDYMLLSLHVPAPTASGPWKAALGHLQAAEDAYTRGDDPTVLQKCHAVFESLSPGSAKTLFDSVLDTKKRSHLDKLMVESKGFLHAGRHVAADGAMLGEFDVDHRDSKFALAYTKVWVAYLGRLLT